MIFPWRSVLRTAERLARDTLPAMRRIHDVSDDASYPVDQAGDYRHRPEMTYAQRCPGGFSSGEIIWTWVAYEDDRTQGKDRPVLIIGSEGDWLLGLPATSKDHDRDTEQELRAGRYWVDIGTGNWDRKRRPSEVRVDRIVRVNPRKVRRAAGQVSSAVFSEVAAEVRDHWDD